MFGLLTIDKPAGMTSRDAVNRVQRLVRPFKVGHAGTLDPLATGVLVIAVGSATRLVEYVQRMQKTYRGTFLLGLTSDSEDVAGQIVALDAPPVPTRAEIEDAVPKFLGTIEQRPPVYSALKVGGRRAHRMARRGEAVALAPRPVDVYAMEVIRYAYPELELLVRCGSGTYVRSLGRDLAEALGTGAVMSALRRLAIGSFRVEDAICCDAVTSSAIGERLLPPMQAVSELPHITLDAQEVIRIARGQSIANHFRAAGADIAALDDRGRLVAILTATDGGSLRATKCFVKA